MGSPTSSTRGRSIIARICSSRRAASRQQPGTRCAPPRRRSITHRMSTASASATATLRRRRLLTSTPSSAPAEPRGGPDGKTLLDSDTGRQSRPVPDDSVRTDKMTQPSPVNASRDKDLQPLFIAGKLAMLETGPWFPTMLKSRRPTPLRRRQAPDGRCHHPVPQCLLAGRGRHVQAVPNKAAAVKFLEYQFNKANRLAFAQQRGVIPERIDVERTRSMPTMDGASSLSISSASRSTSTPRHTRNEQQAFTDLRRRARQGLPR